MCILCQLIMNLEKYSQLLAENPPVVIENDGDYERLLPTVERLSFKEDLTPEEDSYLDLLTLLILRWESSLNLFEDATPKDMLLHLVESNEARPNQAEKLNEIFGSQDAYLRALRGATLITESQALALGKYFKIPHTLFLNNG